MKFVVVVVCAAVVVAEAALAPIYPAATFLRTPQFDSAIVHSDRVGANFAYSTVEGHAYQPVFRAAYPVTYNYHALPYALPAVHPYVATAAAPLPIISPLAPLPTLEIAGADAGKAENVEIAAAPGSNAEGNPAQSEGAKVDGDSVTVESSA